ncbi:hypothetical protein C8A05DRAFT_31267, partial [Staphylotrichum tortipilum]
MPCRPQPAPPPSSSSDGVSFQAPTTLSDSPDIARAEFSNSFSTAEFTGTGTLLTSHCATAQYTLIDYGATATYAAFIGCIDSQPDCCPFTPVSGQDDTLSITPAPGIPVNPPRVYPRPKDAAEAIVNSCPKDFYSTSGSCCPSSYTPWTAPLGGVTPCYSTLPPETTTAAAAKVVQARETKPTVTVSGTVFALQYAVLTDGQKLSAGVMAGIVIGVAVVIGCMLWAAKLVRRKARKSRESKEELQGDDQAPPENPPVPRSPSLPPSVPPSVLLPPPPPADDAPPPAPPPASVPVRQPTVRRRRGDRPRRPRPEPIPEEPEPSPVFSPPQQPPRTTRGLYRNPTRYIPPSTPA